LTATGSDSDYLHKEPCPSCGSRDNLARYSDGHGFCFGCGHYEHGDEEIQTVPAKPTHFLTGEARALTKRALTEATCAKWGYHCGDGVQIANYIDGGTIVGQKLRYPDKSFAVVGSITGLLYGKHLWKEGGRRCYVTEGEIDAMSVSQVLDHKWQTVSLPNGAQGAKKALAANLDWLNTFETVVLCFDMDEPGRKAIADCVGLFPPGKVRIVDLPLKDANEMLVAGRHEELVRCLWDAKLYRPDGIVTASDIEDKVLTPPEEGLPWCIPRLTAATYGRRYGECVALGAGTGIGKTTFITQQIAEDLRAGHKVGVFAFEQMPAETVKRVAGQMVGKTFHIPGTGWTQDELKASLKGLDGLYLYDHFGACDWDVVKERIRYLRHNSDVRIFFLDNLTALAAAADDERKALEKLMAEVSSLCQELGIWLLFVSHLATPDGTPHEEGGRVTIRHFKGSRAIGYWSHFMLGMERDQQSDEAEERGKTVLRVLKDRYTGQATGLCINLDYDRTTGLLVEGSPVSFPSTNPSSGGGMF